jgi:hypothetical protein
MPFAIEAPVTIASFPSNDTVTSLYFSLSQLLTCHKNIYSFRQAKADVR